MLVMHRACRTRKVVNLVHVKVNRINYIMLNNLNINPRKVFARTGKEIKIPASKAVKFTPGKALKDSL